MGLCIGDVDDERRRLRDVCDVLCNRLCNE